MMLNIRLRRVPLDFDWPIDKVWEGFLNPHYSECPHCHKGYTNARIRLQEIVSLLSLAGSDNLEGRNYPRSKAVSSHPNRVPSNDINELLQGLSGRAPSPFTGYNCYAIECKIISAAGLNHEEWGLCQYCSGEGVNPEVREVYEAWESYEPPEGVGYQLWETTSEGSPITPVFENFTDLIKWLVENGRGLTKNFSEEDWLAALQSGCPTIDIITKDLTLPPSESSNSEIIKRLAK